MKNIFLIIPLLLSTFKYSSAYGQSKAFADSVRLANNIPELSYAVITENSTIEMFALGYHSAKSKDTASLDDRFHLGSNTKAMTAFLIASYVEKGKLKWETKFFDLFPQWRKASKAAYYQVTLQDLLSHRAFIQPFQGFDDPEIPVFTGTKQQRRKKFGQFVLTLEPAKKDSAHSYVYSNAGYTLAALMLEKVTGKSWEELMKKVFNQDLNLNIQFSWPENQTRNDTWGHLYENGKLIPVPSTSDYRIEYNEPSGDINIRLKDYIKYIQLHLQGLSGKSQYLKASTLRFLLQGIPEYSLGWYNVYENGKHWISHSGTDGTYYAVTHIDRERKTAYIVFTNCFTEDTQKGVRALMRKLKQKQEN